MTCSTLRIGGDWPKILTQSLAILVIVDYLSAKCGRFLTF